MGDLSPAMKKMLLTHTLGVGVCNNTANALAKRGLLSWGHGFGGSPYYWSLTGAGVEMREKLKQEAAAQGATHEH